MLIHFGNNRKVRERKNIHPLPRSLWSIFPEYVFNKIDMCVPSIQASKFISLNVMS